MPPLRLIFAGSPAAAVPSLRRLAASEHEVAAVVTRADTPQGRKRVLTATPVADAAEELGLPVVKTLRLGPVAEELQALDADLGVIVAFGGLVREPLLSAPRLGWINLHFSLLPSWRGAAPVQRAIMAGEEETGAAVFQLVEELDAGPVFASQRTPIGRRQTAGALLGQLAVSGAELLAGVVAGLADGTAAAVPQTGEPSLAPKLELADGRLDLTRTAAQLDAQIRGTTPEPGAFAELDGARLKILDAGLAHDVAGLPPGRVESRGRVVVLGTGDGALELRTVLPAGRRAMPAADWMRGLGGSAVLS
ncbi:methionyl-tRNA formyltransferase [Homoserinibacter sp. YIM 151385]|uniref:methionyl-tRNA formyltransferase n=1 Tax=Homoserinibacter sp. YIM 151385 TaxID=2985506 RepID=UPI0022EFF619|nr:methionyl-tRNA formyltransferase [Homoserinibacter sp. YIM 151385]WBU38647.1 methionyl-tRNA formyltransferase [Homoserinibacter sp. YIM 151385]